jgi:hypothetical protein
VVSASFVPDYSGVAVPDFHGVPLSVNHPDTDRFLTILYPGSGTKVNFILSSCATLSVKGCENGLDGATRGLFKACKKGFFQLRKFRFCVGKIKMTYRDEWGQDPSVQGMRRIFTRMEAVQAELLEGSKISPLNSKLRRCRERALSLFERAWELAVKRDPLVGEDEIASLYARCLAEILEMAGFEVSEESLSRDERINRLLQEELR